jgi:S-formylglutathione hydrolase FrmB
VLTEAALQQQAARAGRVTVDTVSSAALATRKQYVVYLPPSYADSGARRYPVAYYLHGHTGNEWDWVRAGHLATTLDSLIAAGMPEMIVVMPDGDDGWYTTWDALPNAAACRADTARAEPAASYCVPWPHYDDYIARDLVARVDSTWRTLPVRGHRGIAGLSMGGYGAISLALRYPDVFTAAASHSGVLSPLYGVIRPYAGNPRYATSRAELEARTGPRLWPTMGKAFGLDTAAWWARSPSRLAEHLLATRAFDMPDLWIDVGVDDPYAAQSRDLHTTLERLGVSHVYHENPGTHSWEYWVRHAAGSAAWLAGLIAPSPGAPLPRRTPGS